MQDELKTEQKCPTLLHKYRKLRNRCSLSETDLMSVISAQNSGIKDDRNNTNASVGDEP